MNLESQVALMTIRSQPKTIFERLLQNEELLAFVDLVGGEYPGLGIFDHSQVIAALQTIHTEGNPVSVRTKEGKECRLERLPEGIKATPIENESAGRLVSEFEFLDPLPEIRLKAFAEILSNAHPWFPSASHWQSVLEIRPLSETELTRLVAEIHSCPSHFLGVLQKKWWQGQITAQDLVPTSIFYYQSLLGPLPEEHNVDSYICDVIKPHLKEIVERNLGVGLEFFLPAYLRDDLSPFSLLTGISDEAVYDAILKFSKQDNPFVLLGVLDIAARRKTEDARFKEVAAETVLRLVHQSLVGKDGLDFYELMPPLVRFCFRQLSVYEALNGTPPYWRWLAAFVHTHLLMNVIRTRPLDPAAFSSWCESHVNDRMIYKQLIDMQQEPMWTADSLTSATLRAEIIGRMMNLGISMQHQGGSFPHWDLVQKEVATLSEQGALIFAMCPGPLEGHFRRKCCDISPPIDAAEVVELFNEISTDLEAAPYGDTWFRLTAITRIFLFNPELAGKLENVVRHLEFTIDEECRQSFFKAVSAAGFIAAAQPDESLAEAVAATLVREAAKFIADTDAETGFRLLLIASAAFLDRATWLDWIGQKVTDYVYSLPKGVPCAQLHRSLQEFKTLFPVKEWRFGRASKIVAAALQ